MVNQLNIGGVVLPSPASFRKTLEVDGGGCNYTVNEVGLGIMVAEYGSSQIPSGEINFTFVLDNDSNDFRFISASGNVASIGSLTKQSSKKHKKHHYPH